MLWCDLRMMLPAWAIFMGANERHVAAHRHEPPLCASRAAPLAGLVETMIP
jgi:hypothetical protein